MIKFIALGAGQDVGRSCIVVGLGGRNIMFDCGMHMGYADERRFPDFTLLSPTGDTLTEVIDCVIITHFHLDHCGALPYLTEQCGYRGPIIMTHPAKALCPILLEDYRKIAVERKGESNFFTHQMIEQCIKGRVTALSLGQHYTLPGTDIEVCPYYAGHVLGAAMFWVRVGGRETVLYTGDYNMTADRHLNAAFVPMGLAPDVVITESTYATTFRDSKRAREREFLKNIHECVMGGGKVLVPVFAMGRVQELCILLEAYWERMGLASVPIYFSAGMAETANHHYRVFMEWASEHLKAQFPTRNMFEFKHVRPFEKHYADMPGPMVLFSSPGMLHSGMSLEIFKKWAGDARNMLIIPGFCVSGTVGAKVLAGQRRIEMEDGRVVMVEMQVKNMSFSAHADARGIMQMIRTCQPKNVVLVHGEASKMAVLKRRIIDEMKIACFDPPNGQVLHLTSKYDECIPVNVPTSIIEDSRKTIERISQEAHQHLQDHDEAYDGRERVEIMKKIAAMRAGESIVTSGCCLEWDPTDNTTDSLIPRLKLIEPSGVQAILTPPEIVIDSLEQLMEPLRKLLYPMAVPIDSISDDEVAIRTIKIALTPTKRLRISWDIVDIELAKVIVDCIS